MTLYPQVVRGWSLFRSTPPSCFAARGLLPTSTCAEIWAAAQTKLHNRNRCNITVMTTPAENIVACREYVYHSRCQYSHTETGYNSLSSTVQVLGWDAHGTIVFNAVLCKNNTASNNGGCFYGAGRGIVNDGTAMQNNSAVHGGSIRERNM